MIIVSNLLFFFQICNIHLPLDILSFTHETTLILVYGFTVIGLNLHT